MDHVKMHVKEVQCERATVEHQLAVQLLFYGREHCKPSHAWGPGIRDCYILHFVLDGKGEFRNEHGSYALQPGQGFLITPHQRVHYVADEKQPWQYCWIGFTGLQVNSLLKRIGISNAKPVFKIDHYEVIDQLHNQLLETEHLYSYDFMLQSIIYRIFALLIDNCATSKVNAIPSTQANYIQLASRWIEHHYADKITVADVAQYVGLNSSYLSRLFKQQYNVSLQHYIVSFRMQRAVELLNIEALSISDVSRSVGYTDVFVFSKTFKKIMGVSPLHYRENLKLNK